MKIGFFARLTYSKSDNFLHEKSLRNYRMNCGEETNPKVLIGQFKKKTEEWVT